MRAISHRVQVQELFILATTAKNVDVEALVSKRTMHELSAHVHKLSISHHVQAHELSISHCVQVHELSIRHRSQAHELLITAATTTYVDDKILRASAQGIYIASRDGDDNNNGDDDDECQQQGLGCERPAFSYCVAQRQ